MGRLAWYAGISTALAGGVVVSAFNQRANFYSACVYLAQSNLCLMILINLILGIYVGFMVGLQRLCYGALRPIEIEQLYEKSWFAITETCLAMTIFREEVGAWFLVMFVALLTGKVWGWIGDGRVEILEQQPPANPRLFHVRLSISLTMSVLYDFWLMYYTINTVIAQARPNMMVMFLFEFAILTTSSCATAVRYLISLAEARVNKAQLQERLIERRQEVRLEREELIRQRETAATSGEGSEGAQTNTPLPSEDDIDEMDIEVPGWEAKGQYVLTLDLITDFVKLAIYVTFFVILLMFYGLPIHIMRDLFLTARSFMKRLTAYYKYRRATNDMNSRYPDASVEDIQREDTCIICREDMRPWSVTNPEPPAAAPGAIPPARPAATVNERTRPKKLPCGHILHLGCLKSWLERQQVCPTCRQPVIGVPGAPGAQNAAGHANQAGQGPNPPPAPGQQDGAGAQPPAGGRGPGGMRMMRFGPFRVGFGQANLQDLAHGLGGPQPGPNNAAGPNQRVYGLELGFPRRQPQPQAAAADIPTHAMPEHLRQIEQQISTEIQGLQLQQQELQLVQLLHAELARLRLMQNMQNGGTDSLAANFQMPPMPQLGPLAGRYVPPAARTPQVTQMQRYGARSDTTAIPAGSADLPPGVVLPDGWSLLPLQRLDGPAMGIAPTGNVVTGPATHEGTTATTPTVTSQPIAIPNSISNNTPTPPVTTNSEALSQDSSLDSFHTSAIDIPSRTASQLRQRGSESTGIRLARSDDTLSQDGKPTDRSTSSPEGSNGGIPSTSESNIESFRPFPGSGQTAFGQDHNALLQPHVPSPLAESTSVAASSELDGESEESNGKGKAKAVTVEDVADEAHGS